MSSEPDSSPAGALLGLTLDGGWKVIEEVPFVEDSSGGQHSRGYIVEAPDGTRGYLKALDYSSALRSDDVAGALARATSAYVYERELLRKCENKRLTRIVRPLDHGQVRVDSSGGIPTVDYLILELAEGDIRKYMDQEQTDVPWALRVLHHAATGLNQLHGQRLAHQDLKPSNVLVFDPVTAKLGDLGRALSRDDEAPHEGLVPVGTPFYAPIELFYGYTEPDWMIRCQSCDMYLLGSLSMFLFGGAGTTPAILSRLPESHLPWNWTDSFDEIVPALRVAFGEVMEEFSACLPEAIRDPILSSTMQLCDLQLCDPDPRFRGHPRSRRELGSSYRLDRYVTLYDLLYRKASIERITQTLR
jgi:serine/threonine protein kinase